MAETLRPDSHKVPDYLLNAPGLPDELAVLVIELGTREPTTEEEKTLRPEIDQAAWRVRQAREKAKGEEQADDDANAPGNSNSGRQGLDYANRREIIRLVEDGRFSDLEISRRCGVHNTTIIKFRKQLTGEIPTPESPYVRCGGCGALIDVRKAAQCMKCLLEKGFDNSSGLALDPRTQRKPKKKPAKVAAELDLTADEVVAIDRALVKFFESWNERKALEKLERPKAKERQGRPGKLRSENFTEQEKSKVRDKIGKAIGMSGPTTTKCSGVDILARGMAY